MIPSLFETCPISAELAASFAELAASFAELSTSFAPIDEKRANINRYVSLHLKLNNRLLESYQSHEDGHEHVFNRKKPRTFYHLDNVGTLMVYSKRLLSVRWADNVA